MINFTSKIWTFLSPLVAVFVKSKEDRKDRQLTILSSTWEELNILKRNILSGGDVHYCNVQNFYEFVRILGTVQPYLPDEKVLSILITQLEELEKNVDMKKYRHCPSDRNFALIRGARVIVTTHWFALEHIFKSSIRNMLPDQKKCERVTNPMQNISTETIQKMAEEKALERGYSLQGPWTVYVQVGEGEVECSMRGGKFKVKDSLLEQTQMKSKPKYLVKILGASLLVFLISVGAYFSVTYYQEEKEKQERQERLEKLQDLSRFTCRSLDGTIMLAASSIVESATREAEYRGFSQEELFRQMWRDCSGILEFMVDWANKNP